MACLFYGDLQLYWGETPKEVFSRKIYRFFRAVFLNRTLGDRVSLFLYQLLSLTQTKASNFIKKRASNTGLSCALCEIFFIEHFSGYFWTWLFWVFVEPVHCTLLVLKNSKQENLNLWEISQIFKWSCLGRGVPDHNRTKIGRIRFFCLVQCLIYSSLESRKTQKIT